MSLMVACEDAVFAAHEDLLNTLSSQVFRISQRVGDGARTKLVNNLLAGINLVGAAEVALGLGGAAREPGRSNDGRCLRLHGTSRAAP